MKPLEVIEHGAQIIAMIIRSNFTAPGVHFFTPHSFSQQVAFQTRPKGDVIASHVHNEVPRDVTQTLEVLWLRKGKMRVDFYDDQMNYLESYLLFVGDTILLASGGHGFEALEETELLEVKQGPYSGKLDKRVFPPVAKENLKIRD